MCKVMNKKKTKYRMCKYIEQNRFVVKSKYIKNVPRNNLLYRVREKEIKNPINQSINPWEQAEWYVFRTMEGLV